MSAFSGNVDFMGFEFSEEEKEEEEIVVEEILEERAMNTLNANNSTNHNPNPNPNNSIKKSYFSVDPLTPLPIPPWTPFNRIYSRNYLSFLDEEILDYADFVSPTDGEHNMRLFTLDRLRNQICKLWPEAKLVCFGSFETQLYLPSSDLDCCVVETSVFVPSCLYLLRDQLNRANIALKLDVIPGTKVPILKYVDSLTKFNVDISFNSTNGIETAEIVKSFVESPKLGSITRVLLLLVKQFLVQRHLNEVYTGGLSSYALICMIVSFLRLHPKIQTGEIDPLKNIGVLLIEFFELYGKWFNNETLSIHIFGDEGTKYTWRRAEGLRPCLLSVIDPQDPKNNISSGSFNYTQVKGSFMRAFTMLTSMLGSGFERGSKGVRVRSGSVEMTTLLGSILTLSRDVLDQREYIERVYEAWRDGEVDLCTHSLDGEGKVVGLGMEVVAPVKRKRVPDSEEAIEFVVEESEEEAVTSYSEEDDSGDISAFYSMSNNGKVDPQEIEEQFDYQNKKKRYLGNQKMK